MEELKRFCVPYGNLRRLRIYIIILMGIIVFVAYNTVRNIYIPFSEIIFNIFMILIAFIFGCILYCLVKKRIFDKQLKLYESRMQYFKNNGTMEVVLDNFINGEVELGGNLIVGQDCLIGCNTGMIAFYDEIQRIYQDAKKVSNNTKVKEGESSWLYVVCGDINYQLCAVTLNALFEREVNQICKSVNKRNSNFDY